MAINIRVSSAQWNEEQLKKAKESNTKPYEINKIKPINYHLTKYRL